MYSKTGEIRRDETCLDYSGQEVILYPCHGSQGNQLWNYDPDVSILPFDILTNYYQLQYFLTQNKFQTKLLKHGSSEKCLTINTSKDKLVMEECDTSEKRQFWQLENYDASKL